MRPVTSRSCTDVMAAWERGDVSAWTYIGFHHFYSLGLATVRYSASDGFGLSLSSGRWIPVTGIEWRKGLLFRFDGGSVYIDGEDE